LAFQKANSDAARSFDEKEKFEPPRRQGNGDEAAYDPRDWTPPATHRKVGGDRRV
jgi:hypothetical protein